MTDIDRRRLLQIGGAALTAGLAGCGLFNDSTIPNQEDDGNGGGNGNENGGANGNESANGDENSSANGNES